MPKQIILSGGWALSFSMKKRIIYFGLSFITLAGISCDSENALECFKTAGAYTEKEIAMEIFDKMVVMDEADIYLANGLHPGITVQGGKNIISDIDFSFSDRTLTIKNYNKCLWVRKAGNPKIVITNPALNHIETYDFVNIYSIDTIRYPSLFIFSDGTGNFDLKVNMDSLLINSVFVSNFIIKGKTDFLHLYIINDSRISGKELISDYNRIYHAGSNRLELYPREVLKGQLLGTGSIHLYYKPVVLNVDIQGDGELVDHTGAEGD